MERTATPADDAKVTLIHAALHDPLLETSRAARHSSPLLSTTALSFLLVALVGTMQDCAVAGPVLPPPYISATLSGDTIGDLDPNTNRVTEIRDSAGVSSAGSSAFNRIGTGQVSQPGQTMASLSVEFGPTSAVAASAYSAITGKANPNEQPAPITFEGYTSEYYGYYEGSALARLYFPLEITGPKPTALIDIAALLKISGSGVNAASVGIADASISIAEPNGPAGSLAFLDALQLSGNQIVFAHETNGVFSSTPTSSSSYTENGAYVLGTGRVYEVELYAYADAGSFGSLTSASTSAEGFASVDPTFTIDPATLDAIDYQIVLGDGIGNSAAPVAPSAVPEPPIVALLLIGVASFSSNARRRCRIAN